MCNNEPQGTYWATQCTNRDHNQACALIPPYSRFVGQPHVPYKEGPGRVTGDATFPTDGDGRLGVSRIRNLASTHASARNEGYRTKRR